MEIIVIVAERRMTNFVAGLTNDDPSTKAPVYKQYSYVQYNGTVPASANASVTFPPSGEKHRFVIIQSKFNHTEALCMAEVEVYVRGILAFVCYAKILIPICVEMAAYENTAKYCC